MVSRKQPNHLIIKDSLETRLPPQQLQHRKYVLTKKWSKIAHARSQILIPHKDTLNSKDIQHHKSKYHTLACFSNTIVHLLSNRKFPSAMQAKLQFVDRVEGPQQPLV